MIGLSDVERSTLEEARVDWTIGDRRERFVGIGSRVERRGVERFEEICFGHNGWTVIAYNSLVGVGEDRGKC